MWDLKARNGYPRWYLIEIVINSATGRCFPEQARILRWYQAWWFTVKAIICIALGLREPKSFDPTDGYIDVGMFNFHTVRHAEYTGTDWDTISVRYKGWGYCIAGDGNP